MERILTYQITAEYTDQQIKTFLKSKGFSAQSIITLKKDPEAVCVNGEPAFMNRRLQAGERLRITIQEEHSSEKIPPVDLPLDIVYEDEDLLVMNKPAGMPIHPSLNNYENSLANGLAYYFAKQNVPFVFRCINRLDRDTSGLTIVAKHYVAAGILSEQIAAKTADGAIHREYLAIVRGEITPAAGTVNAPIARTGTSLIERGVDFEKGEHAVTHYRTLKTENGHSLLSIVLETGRTHQIRVHMKYLGYPLIGDYLYNPDYANMQRQALHSYRLSFTHPITGQLMEFTAPLPEDMSKIISL